LARPIFFPATGDIVWAKQYGGSGNDYGTAITCDAGGNIFSTGYFASTVAFGSFTHTAAGNSDVFICRHNNAGNIQWATRYGAGGFCGGSSIGTTTQGIVVTAGTFSGGVNFGNFLSSFGSYDIFLLKSDVASGNPLGAQRFGGVGYDNGRSLCTSAAGDVYVCGSFPGSANFESFNPSSAGSNDVFVLKTDKSVGLPEQTGSTAFSCSPNPFSNILNISPDHPDESLSLLITDLSGNKMMAETISGKTKCLDLSSFPSGIYFLTVSGTKGAYGTKKLIKK
jgi:hypothetical protein